MAGSAAARDLTDLNAACRVPVTSLPKRLRTHPSAVTSSDSSTRSNEAKRSSISFESKQVSAISNPESSMSFDSCVRSSSCQSAHATERFTMSRKASRNLPSGCEPIPFPKNNSPEVQCFGPCGRNRHSLGAIRVLSDETRRNFRFSGDRRGRSDPRKTDGKLFRFPSPKKRRATPCRFHQTGYANYFSSNDRHAPRAS